MPAPPKWADAPKPPPVAVQPLIELLPPRQPQDRESLQPVPGVNSRFCFRCGSTIFEDAAICPHCGVAQPGFMEALARPALGYVQKDSGIASLLSFLCPGAGQMYAGEVGRGVLIFLVWFVSIPLTFVMLCIPTVVIHIWQIFDANSCVVRLNRKLIPRRIAHFD
jgi:TM2 domain-containing membrane protein YozV